MTRHERTHIANSRVNKPDLLRFLAVLAVVFCHNSFRGHAAGCILVMPYPLMAPAARYGYLGVNLFFLRLRHSSDCRRGRSAPTCFLCHFLACINASEHVKSSSEMDFQCAESRDLAMPSRLWFFKRQTIFRLLFFIRPVCTEQGRLLIKYVRFPIIIFHKISGYAR